MFIVSPSVKWTDNLDCFQLLLVVYSCYRLLTLFFSMAVFGFHFVSVVLFVSFFKSFFQRTITK